MKVFATMTMLAALAVAPAFAQGNTKLRADVPFDFVVGRAVLPAGQYDVENGPNSEMLFIREVAGKAHSFVITTPAGLSTGGDPAQLVFRNVGDSHYLQTVKKPNGSRDLSNHIAKGGSVSIVKAVLIQ